MFKTTTVIIIIATTMIVMKERERGVKCKRNK